jgi:hypothetical protein
MTVASTAEGATAERRLYTAASLCQHIWRHRHTGTSVFDVVTEGVVLLPAFDVVAAGGTLRATARDVPVTVTDGALSVAVRKIVDNPQLNVLEILGAPTLQLTQQTRTASPQQTRNVVGVVVDHGPRPPTPRAGSGPVLSGMFKNVHDDRSFVLLFFACDSLESQPGPCDSILRLTSHPACPR